MTEQKSNKEPAQRVTVTDLDISFWSMLKIIFKAFFAAILVGIFLGGIGLVLFVIAMGITGHRL